jgi:hypothetical protein
MGFMPFVRSFVAKMFKKDFNIVTNYPMFIDPQIAFMMFFYYYTQHLGYLLHIAFSFLNIL